MKVKIKVSIASADWAYAPGQIVDLNNDLAGKWIKNGIAEPVREAKVEATAAHPPENTAKRSGGKKGS